MNLLGLGIGAVIVFGAVLSVIWTASGAAMYRSYTRALADEMRRRSLVAGAHEVAEDDARCKRCSGPTDARDVRLGLDLLPGIGSLALRGALRQAAEHADPEVRFAGTRPARRGGDAQAAEEAAALATDARPLRRPAERRAAASALGPSRVVTAGQSMLIAFLDDADPTVRARRSTPWCCGQRRAEIVRRVVARSRNPAPQAARPARSGGSPRGGPSLAGAALARDGARSAGSGTCSCQCGDGARVGVIEPALRDRDRVVVLAALDALDAADGAGVVPPDSSTACSGRAAHASRALAARGARRLR
jgi:hypothetical protein